MLFHCARKFKSIYHLAMNIGMLNTMLYVSDRAMASASRGSVRVHKYYFVAQPVPSKKSLQRARGSRLQLRQVLPGDKAIEQFPRPKDVIDQRYQQGARCIAAFRDSRFVGYLWHVRDRYMEDEVRATFTMMPQGSAAWDFDVHIEPAFRIGVAFLRLWDEANALLASEGMRWSYSRISAYNAESLRAHARLGTIGKGMAVFFKAGKCQLMLSTVNPYIHLSFSPRSSPVFFFDTTKLCTSEPTIGERQSWRNNAAP